MGFQASCLLCSPIETKSVRFVPGTLLDAKIDDLWSQQIRHVYPYIPACAMPKAQAVGFQERLKKTGSIEMVRPTQDNRLTWPVRSPVRLGQRHPR